MPEQNFFTDEKRIRVHHINGDEVEFQIYYANSQSETSSPLLIFFHGAGSTSWTFASLTNIVKSSYQVAAFDCRGHGSTVVHCGDQYDLSIKTLTADGVEVVKRISTEWGQKDILLCGHSMGGSVAAHVGSALLKEKNADSPHILGVCLLDVCGETGLACLQATKEFVKRIPKHFRTLDDAVAWSGEHLVRNQRNARTSTPSQLRQNTRTQLWEWKVNLTDTEKYWRDWFENLDNIFLNLTCSKIVIVAGIDSVAKCLSIANMQGKIQLEVLGKCGHIVQEDQPEVVGEILIRFRARYSTLMDIALKSAWGQAPVSAEAPKF